MNGKRSDQGLDDLDHIAANSWFVSSPQFRVNMANRMHVYLHTCSQASKGIKPTYLPIYPDPDLYQQGQRMGAECPRRRDVKAFLKD